MKIRVQSQPYNKVVKLNTAQKVRVDGAQPGQFIAKATNVDGITVQQGVPSTAVLYSGYPNLIGVGSGQDGATGVTGATGATGATGLGATGATGATGSPGVGESLVSKQNYSVGIMWKGTAVYMSTNTQVLPAQANTEDKKRVLGLVYDPSILPGASGNILTDGILTMLLSEWVQVVADVEGFVGDQYYYLSDIYEGKITRVAPTTAGRWVCPIGYSISGTDLLVRIDPTVAL